MSATLLQFSWWCGRVRAVVWTLCIFFVCNSALSIGSTCCRGLVRLQCLSPINAWKFQSITLRFSTQRRGAVVRNADGPQRSGAAWRGSVGGRLGGGGGGKRSNAEIAEHTRSASSAVPSLRHKLCKEFRTKGNGMHASPEFHISNTLTLVRAAVFRGLF